MLSVQAQSQGPVERVQRRLLGDMLQRRVVQSTARHAITGSRLYGVILKREQIHRGRIHLVKVGSANPLSVLIVVACTGVRRLSLHNGRGIGRRIRRRIAIIRVGIVAGISIIVRIIGITAVIRPAPSKAPAPVRISPAAVAPTAVKAL